MDARNNNNFIHGLFIVVYSLVVIAWNFIWELLWKKGTRQNNNSTTTLLPGARQPRFFEGTYSQAFAEAGKEDKFLLVYLHSNSHVDTPRFCSEVLCTEHVASFLETNFVLWMGDVSKSDAFKLSYPFEVSSFPFFAVMTNISNSQSMVAYLQSLNYNKRVARNGPLLLYKKQGFVNAETLLQDLTETLETHGPLLQAAKAERIDRETERLLRENQDRDYQESLKRDQEKEKQRIEEENRRRLEEENHVREERLREENRLREETERQQRKKREEMERIERERKREEQQRLLMQTIPPEPEKSDKTTDLVIRFSDGSRISRRFFAVDPLQLVINFVSTNEDMENKNLATHYPRKTFPDTSVSLKEAGLYPQATLFVEEVALNRST